MVRRSFRTVLIQSTFRAYADLTCVFFDPQVLGQHHVSAGPRSLSNRPDELTTDALRVRDASAAWTVSTFEPLRS